MSLRKRAIAVAFVAAAAFGALGAPAMAAPMPWETSRTPTVTTHDSAATPAGGSGTVTILCGNPCYQ
ncbi:hypothetical protein [Streptomyces sp. NPDC050534]|uniref:hypothetical protein n=1 Tax=Streptomyces sp. NPDC050534 TaxID=3365625 RepID=UPI00378A570C